MTYHENFLLMGMAVGCKSSVNQHRKHVTCFRWWPAHRRAITEASNVITYNLINNHAHSLSQNNHVETVVEQPEF